MRVWLFICMCWNSGAELKIHCVCRYDRGGFESRELQGSGIGQPLPDSLNYNSVVARDAGLGCIPEHDLLQPAAPSLGGQVLPPVSARTVNSSGTSSPESLLLHPARHAGPSAHRDLRSHKMRRCQSALELGSMASSLTRQPSFQQNAAQKQVGVELTTPEGHTYRAGRLAPEERLQKNFEISAEAARAQLYKTHQVSVPEDFGR
jgi:hypothetical protein